MNPDCDVPERAFRVHGLFTEFLAGHKRFSEIAPSLVGFIGEAMTAYMTISKYSLERAMSTINRKDARAGLSGLDDAAMKGEFITITRHGKPVASLASLEAAEIALKAIARNRVGLVDDPRTFPGGEFARNRSRSRDV